jgi:DNA-binding NarL/FixJ family response regulator
MRGSLVAIQHDEQTVSAARRFGELTERQQEIAWLLADGLTRAEVAARLSLSEYTVCEHVRHIYERLDCHRRSQLVALVLRAGPRAQRAR